MMTKLDKVGLGETLFRVWSNRILSTAITLNYNIQKGEKY